MGQAASVTASALLRGARGNSGVILSLLFRGISRQVKDKATMDGVDFAEMCIRDRCAGARAPLRGGVPLCHPRGV